jgi:3-oxoadipate enol-lactonase
MPIASLNANHFYYEQYGHGQDLVLIGGFTADHTVWADMIEPLSQFYRILVFDNPGAGRSYVPTDNYSLEAMSKDIVALLDYLNIQRAHFIGHSMGAALLMQLCIEYPHKIEKAILCGGPACVPITAKMQIEGLRYAILHQFPNQYIFLSVLPWLYGRRFLSDTNRLEKLNIKFMENPYPQPLAGFILQANLLLDYDLSSRLQKIKADCLIVAADEDLLIPMHCLSFLKKHIPHSRLEIIDKGVGHMFHVEEPLQLAKLAKDYLGINL